MLGGKVLQHPEMELVAAADITVQSSATEIELAICLLTVKDDLLLFYFSGHGITDDSGEFISLNRSTLKDEGDWLHNGSTSQLHSSHDEQQPDW